MSAASFEHILFRGLLEAEVRVLAVDGPRDVATALHILLYVGQRFKPLHETLQVVASVQHVGFHCQPVAHRVVGHDVHVCDALAEEPAARSQVAVQQLVEHDGAFSHPRQIQLEVLRCTVADVEEIKPGVLDLQR